MGKPRKYERALDLHQQGQPVAKIAKAIGSSPSSVVGLIWYAQNKQPAEVKPVAGSAAWWKARGY